jgi:uncharacterized protein (TIGR03118 family)
MENQFSQRSIRRAAAMVAVTVLVTAGLVAAASAADGSYTVTKLVSDRAGVATHQDTNLVNAWGLTSLAGSPWWVSDNGTNVSTLYTADGSKQPRTVNVPDAPTGAVSNSGSSFVITTASGPAFFLFATEGGQILGWNPSLASNDAQVEVPNTDGAVYKGLASASTLAGDFLYATDFHNGRVDMFNGSFQNVTARGSFVDPHIPTGYAPFGIQNVGGKLVVTYAKQDADRHDDVAGQGHGFVDMFDTSGALLGRVATHGQLNSPWGTAMAPASFGTFGGDLLVGNFGDGEIGAFAPQPDGTFELAGQLRTSNHSVLSIDGLWALQFGKGTAANGPLTTLFFTAGPGGESHGLFGTITAG